MNCEYCDFIAKNATGLSAHKRSKHPAPAPAAVDTSEMDGMTLHIPEPEGEPGSWKGHRAGRMQPSSREIKMLRPVCRPCEEAAGGKKYLPPLWFEECVHDPYISYSPREVPQPIMEPVNPEDPNGPKRIVRVDTIVTIEPQPNWQSTTVGGGVNKGRGIQKALWKGYIYPQQLRSPLYPSGIKRRCQFRDCYAEDVKRYTNGWFCREAEAKLVAISNSEETFQVDFDERSRKLQESQLSGVNVRV